MPLTHFLLLIMAVVIAAALTLWALLASGLPQISLLIIVLGVAALVHLVHFGQRDRHHDQDG